MEVDDLGEEARAERRRLVQPIYGKVGQRAGLK